MQRSASIPFISPSELTRWTLIFLSLPPYLPLPLPLPPYPLPIPIPLPHFHLLPVSFSFPVILRLQLFWIAIAELSPSKVLDLLHILWRPLSLPEEAYHVPYLHNQNHFVYGKLPGPFRLMPPTAVALLSPDNAEIQIFPENSAISIPRYSSFCTMVSRLSDAIDECKI